jgi:hypothetical protein
MKLYPDKYSAITVHVRDVPVTCINVEFYEAVAATADDPPEPPIVEWDRVTIGGVEVQELFHGALGSELEDALIAQLEAA